LKKTVFSDINESRAFSDGFLGIQKKTAAPFLSIYSDPDAALFAPKGKPQAKQTQFSRLSKYFTSRGMGLYTLT
jgi:hypothetical protein